MILMDLEQEVKEIEAELAAEDAAGKKERPWIRKTWVILIGMALLAMVVSSFLVYRPTTDIIESIFMSSTLTHNMLTGAGREIVFLNNTLEALEAEYLAHQEREIKACMYGRRNGTHYTITRITFPKVEEASVTHIITQGCERGVLLDVHSLPLLHCVPSEQDINSYKGQQPNNPDLLMIIMCSKKRFSVFRYP
jgi:hypothetical protein